MVFGLIGAGLQIAQTVKGAVDAKKAAKQGDAGGDEAAPAKAAKGAKAKVPEGNPVDRFLGMLDGPNVKSLADIKQVRDKVLDQVKGSHPQRLEDARRKLDQAILKKLGLVPGAGQGDAEVPLTPKTQQVLAALGMKPDEVRGKPG